MHLNILDKNQVYLLPLLSEFKKEFYMVGGTAIALYIGHRKSIDFDLFKSGPIRPKAILKIFEIKNEPFLVTLNVHGQLNLICRDVKFTFFDYDFDIPHSELLGQSIRMPNLLDLSAMKAYALGRRSKWKDYADLYFILKSYYSIEQIAARSKELYGDLFSEKLFRGQLGYYVGVDYTEQIEYMPGFQVPDEEIKSFLIEASLIGF